MFVIGIVERVDVDGKSPAVFRDSMGVRDESEVEARGIVVSHRSLVVGIPIVDESHPLYRIFGIVEFVEDVEHIAGYRLVQYHFPNDASAVLIYVQASEVAKFTSGYGAILLVGLSLHQSEDGVGDGGDGEEMVLSQLLDGWLWHDFSWFLGKTWNATEQRREHDEQEGCRLG